MGRGVPADAVCAQEGGEEGDRYFRRRKQLGQRREVGTQCPTHHIPDHGARRAQIHFTVGRPPLGRTMGKGLQQEPEPSS